MATSTNSGERRHEATRPFSLRLTPRDLEQLQARACAVSGTATGIARHLIVTGLAGGDGLAVAQRLMEMERRLVGIEAVTREVGATAERVESGVTNLRLKFDALLNALSSGGEAS
jgi:hypothetical protein